MSKGKITIDKCTAKEITDSRGKPTITVEMTSGDISVQASVPSGKSVGDREAIEKRDSSGGVSEVINTIEKKIAPELIGKKMTPNEIDELLIRLDGTDNKRNLGANAMLGVSIAATKLAAKIAKKPLWKFIAEVNGVEPSLPLLFMNIINGGMHAPPVEGRKGFRLPFQEYMIVPRDDSPLSAYHTGKHIIELLGKALEEEMGDVPMGDEGGYSPVFDTVEGPFELLRRVLEGQQGVSLAIDAAASAFFEDGSYKVLGKKHSTKELFSIYERILGDFDIISVEDPFEESDIESFRILTELVGEKKLIVGDDLTVTNPSLIKDMIDKKAGNAVIIKPNQIGTLSETYEAARIAREAGWKLIASHRSGETMDTFIADLAVGLGAHGLKVGSPLQKERKVKYERLFEIERELKK